VVGGNRINYPGKVATPMAEMLVAKLLFNSVISTHGARFMTMDIANFYLMTPIKRPEYVKIKLMDIPEEIIVKNKLCDLTAADSNIYIDATKGMYGIPHAGLLAKKISRTVIAQTRLLAEQTSARVMETQYKTHTLHVSG
jgi:hypothetical protein